MGTPVSKTEQIAADDKTTVTLKDEREIGTLNEGNISKDKNNVSGEINKDQLENENEIRHALCAEDDGDDDIDDEQDWGDIYKRLKTNFTDDLHILNTRFDTSALLSLPDGRIKSAGPLFTSAVAERSTKIASAKYNPHTLTLEMEKSRTESAMSRKSYIMEDKELETTDHHRDGSLQLEENLTYRTKEDRVTANTHGESSNDTLINVWAQGPKFQAQMCLDVPNDQKRIRSPSPQCAGSDCLTGDETDIDPFEGLDIPRQRVYSIGSASVYSVKEISDDLFKQYKTDIKNCLRSYGFFEAFPSPSIISEAQKIYRRLDLPAPVDDDGNVLPHPPKVTKSEYLATETNTFEEAKEKIENMPDSLHMDGDIADIVHYLCKGLDDDMGKLTMLSTWIVFQQLQGADNRISKTQEEWCRLFRTMCKFARIKTKLVKGIIRGPMYIPGDGLDKSHGHWLAILINYVWLLLDPFIHQETQNIDTTSKGATADVKSIHLFRHVKEIFQDPEEFIFTHYPDEEHWQLLARPVTYTELSDLAVLRSGYFTFDMTVLNSPKSVMVVKTPETLISLAFKQNELLKFKCKLQVSDDSLTLVQTRAYVFLETIIEAHKINVRVRFPKKGSYVLDIIGFSEEHLWQNVISYRIVYEGESFPKPFPANPREEWGPGMDAFKLGLTPLLYHTGEILMQKGVLQVAFHEERRLQFEHFLFKEDTNMKEDCFKVNILKDKNNDVIFVVDVDTKIVGLFTLQLSAREDANSNYINFCNYLIRKEKTVIIPKLEFSDKSWSTERKEAVHAPDNGTMQFTVDTTGLIQLSIELKLHGRQELNLSDHARHWIHENTGHIELNFPRSGKYFVFVHGREVEKGRIRNIRDETIQVDIPSEQWSCFPKSGNSWNSWYKIVSPLSHHLEEKQDIYFEVIVQNAQDVAIHGANGWFHLDRVDKSWVWVGKVWTGPKSTRCRLLARFDGGSDKWSELLLFKIMAEESYEQMKDRQNTFRQTALDEKKIKAG